MKQVTEKKRIYSTEEEENDGKLEIMKRISFV